MNDHTDTADARDLIDRLNAEADREAAEIVAAARRSAQETVAAAKDKANGRVREEIAALRHAGTRELARVAAHIDTERRKLMQARHAAAMEEGLALLGGALDDLWAAPDSRTAWCANVLEEAKARLLPGAWELRHPPGWPPAERDAMLVEIAAETGHDPSAAEDASLNAGLVIASGSACIDGTPAALTRDRARLGALFLREMAALQNGGGE